MTRWEYLYFTDAEKETSTLHPPAHKEKLNELGKEGWELVSVVFDQKAGDGSRHVVCLPSIDPSLRPLR